MRSPRTAMKSSPCSPQLEKARAQQRRRNAGKNKLKKKKKPRSTIFPKVLVIFKKHYCSILDQTTYSYRFLLHCLGQLAADRRAAQFSVPPPKENGAGPGNAPPPQAIFCTPLVPLLSLEWGTSLPLPFPGSQEWDPLMSLWIIQVLRSVKD